MQVKVSKGLATWAGIIAAVGQYALAVAAFLQTFDSLDPLAGLGPLLTATATLIVTIVGRMSQAKALSRPVVGGITSQALASTYAAMSGATGNAPQPHADVESRPDPDVDVDDIDYEPFDIRHEQRDLHDGRES